MKQIKNLSIETRRFIHSLLFPLFFQLVIWMVWLVASVWSLDLAPLGILPRHISGLKGILFAPLIHAGFDHLASNALPLFLLMWAVLYFYRTIAYRVFFISWIAVGLLVWAGGREAYHIGASGIIYSLAAFLFFSGIIRNYIPLMAISLLVAFLYGSMVWGMFPTIPKISWESHMLGAVAGIFLAIIYRKQGPQPPPPFWDTEEDDEDSCNDDENKPTGTFPFDTTNK
ncbi:MAG: rhomboid family intramembrane serine protease [Chlorobi bacterium]|nr:rhomboid family intramembrane serine protease [Chlorobiota bacterium]